MALSRRAKIGLAVPVVLIAGLGLGLYALAHVDWNRARPWVNQRVSDAIGRPFSINGALAVTWHSMRESQPGWRGWLPWPQITAQDVHIGNPAGDARVVGELGQVGQLDFFVSPFGLLGHTVHIPALNLNSAALNLQRDAEGHDNWTFTHTAASAWKLDLQSLNIDHGTVHVADAIRKVALDATIDSIRPPAADGYALRWNAKGSMGGDPVTASGKAGSVLAVQSEAVPFPLEAEAKIGKTSIQIKGTLTEPADLAAINVRLHLAGASMAQLYALTGIVLPESPPYSTEGDLRGTINAAGGNWVYDKFSGKMGGSDIAGSLAYFSRPKRPLLTGTVVSKLLRLEDLGPLIGADNNTSKRERDAPVQPADKVLPVERFKTERWTSIDADVNINGQHIERKESLPIDALQTHLKLTDGVLQLQPLDFSVAGGTIHSDVNLDGRQNIIKAKLVMSGRHMVLAKLFPTVQDMDTSLGEISSDASLTATGTSIAGLLGSSNGELKALLDKGTISKLLVEKIGLNIGNVVLAKLVGDRQIKINCVAGEFAVTNGLMRTQSLVVDTEESLLQVAGNVNLATEQMSMVIKPQSRGLRVFTLRAPIYVVGTFKHPDVSVDKGVVALKAGSAIALGLLAPAAALLPLANMGKQAVSDCPRLLDEARIKPVSPAPGKTASGARAQVGDAGHTAAAAAAAASVNARPDAKAEAKAEARAAAK